MKENIELFEKDIDAKDILQGQLSNCYLLSAICSMTHYPKMVRKLFKEDKVQTNGRYTIILYLGG
jgi:hypothetical protein